MGTHLVRWIAAASGLIAMAAAVLVITAVAAETQEGEGSTPGSTPATETLASVTPQTSMPIAPVTGIDDAVSGALALSGYTEMLTTSELEDQLPPAVVAALEDAGAVLVVPNEDGNDGG